MPAAPTSNSHLSRRTIAYRYTVFAAAATAVNLATQYISFLVYDDTYSLGVAILAGTATGLVTKYILDRKYIFYYVPNRVSDDLGTFVKYTGTGVFTTIIFWGTEIAFDYFFGGYALYIGAVVGLSIGYVIKYKLDKKLVFVNVIPAGQDDEAI